MAGTGVNGRTCWKTYPKCVIERFNGTFRRGILDKLIFEDLNQVREQTNIWMDDYKNYRPHGAWGKMAPLFTKKQAEMPLNSYKIIQCSVRNKKNSIRFSYKD